MLIKIMAVFIALLSQPALPSQNTANPGLRIRGHVSGIPLDAPDGLLSSNSQLQPWRSIGSDGFQQEKRLGGEFCITPVGRCGPAGASEGDSLGFSLPAGPYDIRG
jgi:hypothetical protein